jgi:uncharacterized protein
MTPLHKAAVKGNMAAAKALLSKQADVESRTPNGMTALHLAAWKGHATVVRMLLAHGASITVRRPPPLSLFPAAGSGLFLP